MPTTTRQRATEARNEATSASKDLGRVVQDVGLATLGLGDRIRELAVQLPDRIAAMSSELPNLRRDGWEDLVERGRKVSENLRGSASIAADAARADARATVRSTSADTKEAVDAATEKAVERLAPSERYEDRTLDELRELAARRNIEGRSSMNKKQLVRALRQR